MSTYHVLQFKARILCIFGILMSWHVRALFDYLSSRFFYIQVISSEFEGCMLPSGRL